MKLLFGNALRAFVILHPERIRRRRADFCWRQITSAISIRSLSPRSCGEKSIGWRWRNFFRIRFSDFFCERSMHSRRLEIAPTQKRSAPRWRRLKEGRIVGIFPEGGIRDGARSLLEGAPLRPGAATLAHMAGVSGFAVRDRRQRSASTRARNWLPFRRFRSGLLSAIRYRPLPDLKKQCGAATHRA